MGATSKLGWWNTLGKTTDELAELERALDKPKRAKPTPTKSKPPKLVSSTPKKVGDHITIDVGDEVKAPASGSCCPWWLWLLLALAVFLLAGIPLIPDSSRDSDEPEVQVASGIIAKIT